jgi:uncharacterized protein (DUF1499 family)
MPSTYSNFSKAAHRGGTMGVVAVACLVVGAGGAWLHVLPAFGGFIVMVFGLVVALAGLVTSLFGVHATRPHKNTHGRSHALRGLGLSLLVIAFVLLPARRGGEVPRINDISTDLEDPPVFVSAATLEANHSRDMTYPGSSFAEQQQKAYPDLASLVLEEPPAVAFDHVHTALLAMPRMEIVAENREEGHIEAVQTSALFHFADDVVVRIRPFEGGSRIDVRSKSRNGKGDLGVNAARIRDLFARLRGSAPVAGN